MSNARDDEYRLRNTAVLVIIIIIRTKQTNRSRKNDFSTTAMVIKMHVFNPDRRVRLDQ